MPAGGTRLIAATALGSLLGLVVVGLLLLPVVRRAAARILPRQFDPRSSVHAIALSLIGGAIIISFGQLAAAGSVPPLLEIAKSMSASATSSSDAEHRHYSWSMALPGRFQPHWWRLAGRRYAPLAARCSG